MDVRISLEICSGASPDIDTFSHGVDLIFVVIDESLRRFCFRPQTQLSGISPEFFDLILAFNAALKAGHKITALRHTGFWADIGNPRSLWETNLLVHKMPEKVRSKILGAPAVQGSQAASGDFTVDRESVISPTAQVGKHAVIKNSVLLAGAEVLESEILTNIIRGFDLDTGFHD
jgi:NDP-sugar pyrophosphorylase family protein